MYSASRPVQHDGRLARGVYSTLNIGGFFDRLTGTSDPFWLANLRELQFSVELVGLMHTDFVMMFPRILMFLRPSDVASKLDQDHTGFFLRLHVTLYLPQTRRAWVQ